jgi:5-methylcytosine-specific restriction protein B
MVDYALRRRFSFARLRPAYATEAFSEYLVNKGVGEGIVQRIVDRMEELNATIREQSKDLGAGFEIGHSFFCPIGTEEDLGENWYKRIIETEIAPLLHEYWFDDPEKANRHIDAVLR